MYAGVILPGHGLQAETFSVPRVCGGDPKEDGTTSEGLSCRLP